MPDTVEVISERDALKRRAKEQQEEILGLKRLINYLKDEITELERRIYYERQGSF